jgi:transcriptional antiterminator NusG
MEMANQDDQKELLEEQVEQHADVEAPELDDSSQALESQEVGELPREEQHAESETMLSEPDASSEATEPQETADLAREEVSAREDDLKPGMDEPANTLEAQEPGELPQAEAATAELDEAMETPQAETASDEDGRAWYVVHCYSGYENKVRHNLEQRIESMGMKDRIFDVVVPTEEEIEVREGKRKTVERRVFPGYILVNMLMSEESWYVVRNTPGVTGFVGMGNQPTPLRPEEVSQIIKRMEAEAPRIKVTFKQGERVRIVDGPFNDFRGTVSEIDMEKAKVRVMVNFFGRETPVELDFLQVEKA